jgi:hypothetical protein
MAFSKQTDQFIDELLRLQGHYAGLIWRLKQDGDCIDIEFFLEEMALDCRTALVQAGIPISNSQHARRVSLQPAVLVQNGQALLANQVLDRFLNKNAIRKPHTCPVFKKENDK